MANSYECNVYIIDEIEAQLEYPSDKISLLTLVNEINGTLEVKNFDVSMTTIIDNLTP